MIQRIQSLFLLAVGLLMSINLLVPFWQNNVVQRNTGVEGIVVTNPFMIQFTAIGQISPVSHGNIYYIAGLSLMAAAFAFYSIFQYKSRTLQMRIGLINYLFIVGTLGAYFIAIDHTNGLFDHETSGNYTTGFYLPIVSIIFNFLANRFIKKDDDLVKSVDRIR